MVWELASWPDVDSSGAPLTQATSHEDWFYSITQSRTALGVQDGFVAAGYSKYPDVMSTTCRTSCFNQPCPMATISKIGPSGAVEWFDHNDAEGSFWRVINTSDGGSLAVGHSRDRPLFGYNPVSSVGSGTLLCGPTRLLIVAKFTAGGAREWQYAYGWMEDPNDHRGPGPGQTQERQDTAWGAVELAGGGYRVVGHAVDPDEDMNPRAFAMDIDEYGGVEERMVFGEPGYRSEFMGIARAGSTYFLVGTQYDGPYEDDDEKEPYGDVFVLKIGEDLSGTPVETLLMETAEEQDTGFDIAVAGDGSVHVAYIENCVGAGRGGCFRNGPGGIGVAWVARLDSLDLSIESQTSLGTVHAHDLFVRLTELSDGGVGFVSTIQPVQPVEPSFTHTDAYVVKLDEEGDVVWQATHDARTSMPHTGTDDLSQECLYDIAEAEDGGLVVAGNNSSNDDDNYVLRFAIEDVPALPAPTVRHSHLVLPELDLSPNTVDLSGDLEVRSSGRLWVDSGRMLAFEEDARLFARGALVTDGATLTAQNGLDPWGGVVVASDGTVATLSTTVVEYAGDAGVAVYAPARVELGADTLRHNGVGLGVYSDGGNGQPGALVEDSEITDNGIGVVTDFTCTWDSGSMPTCSGFTSAESWVRVAGSLISANEDEGVLALNADVELLETDVELNGQDGITLVNTTLDPFTDNTVSNNGSYGLGVLISGEFFGSPTTAPGENTISSNTSTEVWVHDSGWAFLGSSTSNGRNAILDGSGGLLVRYSASADPGLSAGYQWWGSGSFNPASVFSGEITYCPFYTCNPVGNPSCTQTSCDQFHAGGGTAVVSPGERMAAPEGSTPSPSSSLGVDFIADLGAEVRAVRSRISATPADEAAPAWIRRLGYLHILDALDESGERGESFALLRALREALSGANVPAGVRAAAEAALEVEALAALSRELYAAANALLETYAGRVEGEGVQRHLGLVRALLLARQGEREAASELVASLAATSQDAEETRALSRLATALGRSPGSRGTSTGSLGALSGANAAPAAPVPSVSVAPNPIRDRARVALLLDTESHVRITIHDVLGREVVLLTDAVWTAGRHMLLFDAARLAPGAYLLRTQMQDGRVFTSRRVTVLR